MERFRGGLVFKAHRLLCHSILGSRVINKKKKGSHKAPQSATPTSGFRVSCLWVSGFRFQVSGFGFRVSGLGFPGLGLEFRYHSPVQSRVRTPERCEAKPQVSTLSPNMKRWKWVPGMPGSVSVSKPQTLISLSSTLPLKPSI